MLRCFNNLRPHRFLLLVGLRLRIRHQRLSQDWRVAGWLLHDLEHLSEWGYLHWSRGVRLRPSGDAQWCPCTSVRVLHSSEHLCQSITLGLGWRGSTSWGFSKFRDGCRSGLGCLAPLEIPRRLCEPKQLDLYWPCVACRSGSVRGPLPNDSGLHPPAGNCSEVGCHRRSLDVSPGVSKIWRS